MYLMEPQRVQLNYLVSPKYMPYIMDLTFYKYYVENQNKEQITGYTISEIN